MLSWSLMFMPDPPAVLAEMARCVRPGGRVGLAVWEALERSPAYPVSVELLERRAGRAGPDALRAPFVHDDVKVLSDLFACAGLGDPQIDTQPGTARFPSLRVMVEADLRGWLPVMGVELDEDLITALLDEAETLLAEFVTDILRPSVVTLTEETFYSQVGKKSEEVSENANANNNHLTDNGTTGNVVG